MIDLSSLLLQSQTCRTPLECVSIAKADLVSTSYCDYNATTLVSSPTLEMEEVSIYAEIVSIMQRLRIPYAGSEESIEKIEKTLATA